MLNFQALDASKPKGKIIWTSSDGVALHSLTGAEARPYWKELAAIRLGLFKEYPYLYEGTEQDEKEYNESLFASKNSTFLLVFDHSKMVGYSVSVPLSEESDHMKKPFVDMKLDVKNYLYISEVLLMPEYRKKGFLKAYMNEHEKIAKEKNIAHTCLISIERPDNHPLKPTNYRPVEPIWMHYGYRMDKKHDIKLDWRQVDTHKKEMNVLNFWVKRL